MIPGIALQRQRNKKGLGIGNKVRVESEIIAPKISRKANMVE